MTNNIYWRPKKKPKEIAGRTTAIGLKRNNLVDEWTRHALDEHGWGLKDADHITAVLSCAGCAEYLAALKATEKS